MKEKEEEESNYIIDNDTSVVKKKTYRWIFPPNHDRNITATINQFVVGTDIHRIGSKEKKNIKNKKENIEKKNFYTIPVTVPKISSKTYFDIAYNIINKRNLETEIIERCSLNFKYLKFTKKNEITRACLKKIAKVSVSVCPKCRRANCWRCCNNNNNNNNHCSSASNKDKNIEKKNSDGRMMITITPSSVIISCYNCGNIFKARILNENFITKKQFFYSILGFQSKKCKLIYENIYKEFCKYMKWKKRKDKNYASGDTSNKKKLFELYNALTLDSKKDLKYQPDNLNYCLRVSLMEKKKVKTKDSVDEKMKKNKKKKKSNSNDEKEVVDRETNKKKKKKKKKTTKKLKKKEKEKIKNRKKKEIIIPPMVFFLDRRKTISFFKKILTVDSTMAIKTRYGSVFSRGSGGKTNIFRTMCCNRRHVLSARIVIVPRYQLKPHECILPFSIFSRLGCPKFVLCHRYPTLDLKSMTFHYVKGTWQYPSMAISTSIVGGNNADFDGDCLHVIPAMSLVSQSELLYLLHPRYNIICQDRLRVLFDHDERQTLFSLFGLDANEIHDGLRALAVEEGSEKAYDYFCKFKSLCNFTWETRTVNTISCRDFLDIIPIRPMSYIRYRNEYYRDKVPQHNGIKEMIESKASRFGFDHAWQLFGEISHDAPVGFLRGMEKNQFIKIAKSVRNNLVSEISLYGYTIIKLTHCTKSITIGYDGRVYTTDGVLVALNAKDLIS